jgi:hypothetical protein
MHAWSERSRSTVSDGKLRRRSLRDSESRYSWKPTLSRAVVHI